LQAHLTGKALRVFTELSTDECQHCQDYPTVKNALHTAFAVVPEVHRQRFTAKTRSETYSVFATQFVRWCESTNACSDVAVMRELILMEQFTTHLEAGMRGWLIDQKPKTLSELPRLADQYVAVHAAERPSRGSINPRAN